MRDLFTVTHLTLHEAMRRRVLTAALIGGLAFVVLFSLYALFYGWLPDIPQRLRTVLPGALVGATMWLIAAGILSYTLRSATRLSVVYGSFAGTVATLVFLYASAVTLIFGAEINGILRERRPPGSGHRKKA